jgi:hypothetical protein
MPGFPPPGAEHFPEEPALTLQTLSQILYKGALVHGIIFTVYSLIRRNWSTAHKMGMVILFAWVYPAWIVRSFAAGHLPIAGAYESFLSLAFFSGTVLFALSLLKKQKLMVFFPITVSSLLIYGIQFDKSISSPAISEKNIWTHLFAFSVYIASGFALAVFTSSAMILIKKKNPDN